MIGENVNVPMIDNSRLYPLVIKVIASDGIIEHSVKMSGAFYHNLNLGSIGWIALLDISENFVGKLSRIIAGHGKATMIFDSNRNYVDIKLSEMPTFRTIEAA